MVWPTAAHRWHFVLRDVSWFTVYSIADLLTSSHPHLSASNLLGLQGPQQTLASLEIIKITAIARFRYAYVYIMNVGKWEFGTVHRILEASLNLMAEIQILTFFHQSFLVASILYSRVTTPAPPPLSQILNSSVFLSCNEIFYLSAAFIFHATSTTRISLLAPYVTALYGNVIFAASISCSTPDSSRISFTTFPFSLTTSFDLFPVATWITGTP